MRAVITGAAGGIGSACVRHLMKIEDMQVIAISRSSDGLKELLESCNSDPGDLETLMCDFEQDAFVELITARVGESEVDFLINNAGILINKSFDEMTAKEVERQLHLNYTIPYQIIQTLLPNLKAAPRAHIVNIGSMGGFQGSDKFPGLSAYSGSKAALANLTECLAYEYADTKMRFNCLALGSVNTEMLKKAFPTYTSTTSPDEMASFIVDFTMNGGLQFNGKVLPVAGINT